MIDNALKEEIEKVEAARKDNLSEEEKKFVGDLLAIPYKEKNAS